MTSDGVVVCDGQGTVENTKRLLADIARLRPAGFDEAGSLPIKTSSSDLSMAIIAAATARSRHR